MSRIHADWLKAYIAYTEHTEAPTHMRFWSGVSAIAGALRRKVWIDQAYFKWYANFYIILVAPPGVVAKSTTSGVAMNLLRQLDSVKFGPDIVTWQSLVETFAAAGEGFETPPGSGVYYTMSPLTLESSEFGNLLDPQDREMVDLFVALWDGKQGSLKKNTKTSGNDEVLNPWINLIACTTPAWIAGSFPDYMIGGGFTSRCVFVYADRKARRVAYPILEVPPNLSRQESALVEDLRSISLLAGEYKLTPEAYEWGTEWYNRFLDHPPVALQNEQFGGYIARKQTHIHKLAMVIAAAKSDGMWIEASHLATANEMVTSLEPDMVQVFSKMGRSEESNNAEKLLTYLRVSQKVEWAIAFQYAFKTFPGLRNFENVVNGLIQSKLVMLLMEGGKNYLVANPVPGSASAARPPAPPSASPSAEA